MSAFTSTGTGADRHTSTSSYDSVPTSYDSLHKPSASRLPQIPINLHEKKLAIALHWFPIVLTTGILPIVGYFSLKYATTVSFTVNVAIWLAIMGVVSVFSLGKRTYLLLKKNSRYLPLGQASKWGMDYFEWNFLFGFVALTILISLGTSLQSIKLCSLPTAVLLIYVSFELVVAGIYSSLKLRTPFRFSSVPQGQQMRGGCYAIIEDVVAVDAGYGESFRQVWSDRYEASSFLRAHLVRMDFLWGVSGLCVAAAIFAIVLAADSGDAGFAVGFALPWVWAFTMIFITIRMTQSMLEKEHSAELRLDAPRQNAA